MIKIALPKGRLGQKILSLFGVNNISRKLIFNLPDFNISCLWVKPFDVPVYVELGTADAGIVGSDVLMERDCDVYELLSMNAGKCRISVAAPDNFSDDADNLLKVATELPKIASDYFASLGRMVDIIPLRGSTELAAITGLAHVIVDIVETGETLRANNLREIAKITDISGKVIVNKSAYKFKRSEIDTFIRKVHEIDKNYPSL